MLEEVKISYFRGMAEVRIKQLVDEVEKLH